MTRLTTVRSLRLLILVACLAGATTALAQTPKANEPSIIGGLAKILAPEPGHEICYARVYDDAHLARHPRQQVTRVAFMLRVSSYSNEGTARPAKLEERVYYQFGMQVKRRGERQTLRAAGNCHGDGKISCVVECDGGGVEIERKDGSLLVTLNDHGIKMEGDCDGKAVWVKPGADDKVFRVEPAPPETCKALAKELAP